MQYIVTCYDGTDDKALDRRMAAREAHLEGVKRRFEAGEHLYGMALLSDEGKMIGSVMVVEYPSMKELNKWLEEEPYIIGKVWERVEPKPCKVAPLFMELYK